jgi:uncharacterized protein
MSRWMPKATSARFPQSRYDRGADVIGASELGKLIFFLLAGVVIFWWLRKAGAPAKRPASQREPETMVSCAYCGLHIPQKESVAEQGRYYCGKEHQRLDGNQRRG